MDCPPPLKGEEEEEDDGLGIAPSPFKRQTTKRITLEMNAIQIAQLQLRVGKEISPHFLPVILLIKEKALPFTIECDEYVFKYDPDSMMNRTRRQALIAILTMKRKSKDHEAKRPRPTLQSTNPIIKGTGCEDGETFAKQFQHVLNTEEDRKRAKDAYDYICQIVKVGSVLNNEMNIPYDQVDLLTFY